MYTTAPRAARQVPAPQLNTEEYELARCFLTASAALHSAARLKKALMSLHGR
jgi:hypothetical protein